MVQMPTGTGKTRLMAAVVSDFMSESKENVWIVAHRRELVCQIKNTIYSFGMDCDRVKVLSIQWLTRNLDKMSPEAPCLIVIDEAHHVLAESYKVLWDRFPDSKKLGLTATPCRMSRAGFTDLFGCLLTSWSVRTFIEKGRLALFDYFASPAGSDDLRIIGCMSGRGADGDFSISEMSLRLDRTPNIARLYRSYSKYASGKKGIVYAINIDHAKHISDYYVSMGVRSAAIDCTMDSVHRDGLVSDFREGRLDVLVNVSIFDEGFDCPDVEFIQLARPTLSLSRYLQQVGRGLRVHPDGNPCVILDNVGMYRLFGLPTDERDWQEMFNGEKCGKGDRRVLTRNNKSCVVPCGGMLSLVNHHRLVMRTKDEDEDYFHGVKPFEENGRWGIRVDDDIILRPIYRCITPFVGNYCAFELIPKCWGVLTRHGKIFIPAQFTRIDLLPDGDAILYRSSMVSRRVHLDTTLDDPKDKWEWWTTLEEKEAIVNEKLIRERMKRLDAHFARNSVR